MTTAHAIPILCYTAMALTWLCTVRAPFKMSEWMMIQRSAWSSAWLFTGLLYLFSSKNLFTILNLGMVEFFWTIMVVSHRKNSCKITRRSVIVTAIFLPALTLGIAAGAGLVSSSLLGFYLYQMTASKEHLVLRTSFYVASFFGTFGVLLPRTASALKPELFSMGITIPRAVPAMQIGVGVILFLLSVKEFILANGTPEPIDPPSTLCTNGIYRHMRNPMQLGQVLIVTGCCFLIGTSTALVYAIFFALILMLPVRMFEEHKLLRRYGPSYKEYSRRVGAYATFFAAPNAVDACNRSASSAVK